MSWELASFLILGAVLIGGFAWYERSRPSSQVIALVAALAALAVAGRVAFAALPNVVATTDIVIFAGFALGPAPGFAVGALAGLVSNFWLGQGPWTPWQMAGWGMCGVLGAGLALVRPRANRFTLAAFCALAGVAYGALLNFSLMATYGGDLSLQRFLALEARAVPFDAAHAIGNAGFALVAGPAMVRMLVRFRKRFEWRAPAVASRAAPRSGAPQRPARPGRRRRPRRDPRRDLARRAAELRRRLGRLAGRRLLARNDRLGDAGPRVRRPQPARRHPRRPQPGRLPARPRRRAEEPRGARPHDPRPAGGRRSTRAPSAGATWSKRCSSGGAPTAPSKAGRRRRPSRSSRCAAPAPPGG